MYVSIRITGLRRAAWVPVALPGMVSWHAGIITLGAVLVTGVLRLLTEWQRRTTLIALMRNAPAGTVVLRHDRDTGDAARVWVGDDGVLQVPAGDPGEPAS
jgi:hypothetical protein